MTYRLNPSKVRDESASVQHVLKYLFTQYSLCQGLREFPTEGQKSVDSEFQELHDKNVFELVMGDSLTRQEKLCVLNSVIFIKQKGCG